MTDKEPTEDERVFGKNVLIYCRQHMRVHETGWCTVSVRDKIALGVESAAEGRMKCYDWKLPLYDDQQTWEWAR